MKPRARSRSEAAALERRAAEVAAAIDGEERTHRRSHRRARGRASRRWSRARPPAGRRHAAARPSTPTSSGAADPTPALAEAREQLEAHQTAGARCEEQVRAADERIARTEDALAVLAGGGGECPVCGHVLDAKHRAEAKRRLSARCPHGEGRPADGAGRRRDGAQGGEAAAPRTSGGSKRLAWRASAWLPRRLELLARLERLEPVSHRARRAPGRSSRRTRPRSTDDVLRRRGPARARRPRDARRPRPTTHRRTTGPGASPGARTGRRRSSARSRRPAGAGTQVVADVEAAVARVAQLDADHETPRADDRRSSRSARRRVPDAAALVRTCAGPPGRARAARPRARGRAGPRRGAPGDRQARRAGARGRPGPGARSAPRHGATGASARRSGAAASRSGSSTTPCPQLTDDANRILGRLSDHEMSVQLPAPARDQAGKAKETFEALVPHDGGVRDFAMFSGGEAFRVAFAVRLAMSKLLVARAGRPPRDARDRRGLRHPGPARAGSAWSRRSTSPGRSSRRSWSSPTSRT